MKNFLIGCISGNYTLNNIQTWVETSNYENITRILFYYNATNQDIIDYCKQNNVEVIIPNFDMFGNEVPQFLANSGELTIQNSPYLIHHVRFLHWWYFLQSCEDDDLVLLTDVNDVMFNGNPFDTLAAFRHDGIVASSEEVTHEQETWNLQNFWTTFGIITEEFKDKYIYNAGSIAGNVKTVSDLCRDIYLLSINKPRNADQAAYNYLIQTAYKHKTLFTNLDNNWGVHLHVINQGLVEFDLDNCKNYKIIHQYDRIKNFKL
jgi:hypothetical protein